jgi:hypothetical protein
MNNQNNESGDIMRIGFDVAELQVIKLEPGDVLSIKLIGDECCNDSTLQSLQHELNQVFKNNKVIVFAMPNNNDMIIEAIRPQATPSKCAGCRGGCETCNPEERTDNDETEA